MTENLGGLDDKVWYNELGLKFKWLNIIQYA